MGISWQFTCQDSVFTPEDLDSVPDVLPKILQDLGHGKQKKREILNCSNSVPAYLLMGIEFM